MNGQHRWFVHMFSPVLSVSLSMPASKYIHFLSFVQIVFLALFGTNFGMTINFLPFPFAIAPGIVGEHFIDHSLLNERPEVPEGI